MNFGQAIEALKEGKLISRSGWNGKGMYVLKQIPATIGLDIIPKMQSLPQAAKDNHKKRSGNILHQPNVNCKCRWQSRFMGSKFI